MKLAIFICMLAITATAHAQYQPHAIWSREGARDSSLYGTSILALGDQNGDGFNDWAVFAQANANDMWHGAQLGYIEFFHGGNPPESEPYMVRTLDTTNEESLWNAYNVGDLNGDHYIDWIVVAQLNDGSFNNVWKLYFGGPGAHDRPDLVLTAPGASGYYPVGDFNGHGFDDLQLNEGLNNYAAIYYGGNPMDTIPDWVHHPTLVARGFGHLNGDRYSDFISDTGPAVGPQIFFGGEHPDTLPAYNFPTLHSVATSIVRDINRDGFDELCVTRSGFGGIYRGSLNIDSVEDTHLNFPCYGGPEPGGPDWIVSAGDFNHDGFNDVVMATETCPDSWYGTLTVHLGGWWVNPQPAFVIEGWSDPFNLIHFKTAKSLGDINGDHIDDLAIGANGGIERDAWRGKVVILGGDSMLHADAQTQTGLRPASFSLSCFPNPFNASTTISFTLPKTGIVELKVYDLTGRIVRNLAGGHIGPPLQAGEHRIEFDGGELPSGIYFVRMEVGGVSQTQKMVLLK